MKKYLLPALLISTSSMAMPKADILFTELVTLRNVSPAAFEAAFAFNRARLIECDDVLSLEDYSKHPSFMSLNQYFINTKGVKDEGFKTVFEQSKTHIKCDADITDVRADNIRELVKLNQKTVDIAAEYSAQHGEGEGLNTDLLDSIAVSKSDMTVAERKNRIDALWSEFELTWKSWK